MADKIIVLITGCSSGIGLATAVILAKDPDCRFRVYATMRNSAKKKGTLESAVGGEGAGILDETLFIRELDVSKTGDQKGVVDWIVDKEGRVDVLGKFMGICMRLYRRSKGPEDNGSPVAITKADNIIQIPYIIIHHPSAAEQTTTVFLHAL